ncbi:hypothetical protein J7E96_24355 [Streptomyces sp. ISL-96]|uniref:DUF6302 family protein n=1 Tax=Streptomyces sp. ISL-96 TaxID=2819191 RepID=UPI001BE7B1CE|nr:DUF6302 family protein [Streptomyces sp. ISL-96]MBT2491602.1 hypothetical protein [Streptomyces sp. ISL-96]
MPTATRPGPLTVSLLPPHEAYDYEYYKARLADPALLEDSVAICVFRAPLLAIPAGGQRLGGYHPVTDMNVGLAVRDLLQGRPGFTNLRLRWSPYPDSCPVVEWGEKSPTLWGRYDYVTLGRFYGYSDVAIDEFSTRSAARRGLQTPSSAPRLRSPAVQ